MDPDRQIGAACRLTNLQRLALLSNRLESMAGLSACTALQELYLSHNGLTAIEVRMQLFGHAAVAPLYPCMSCPVLALLASSAAIAEHGFRAVAAGL